MRSAALLCRCLAALKSQTIFGSEQEIAIVVNDNRIRLSIADIRMGAAGLVGLAADSCPTHRLPSDPANPEEPFSVVDSSQSDAFALRIELRGVTGLVVPLIGGPPEIQIWIIGCQAIRKRTDGYISGEQSRLSQDYQSK
jgi:hypothetical protein